MPKTNATRTSGSASAPTLPAPGHRVLSVLSALPALLWLGLFPLANDFSYAHITRGKWLFLLAFTALALLLTAAVIVRRRREGFKPGGAFAALAKNPALCCGLIYFFWVALSAAFGSHAALRNGQGQLTVLMGAVRYEGLLTFCCYLLIFVCLALLPGHGKSASIGAGAALVSFAAVVALQYAGANPFGLFPAGLSVRTTYEFQGTIGNIDMVSGYLCLVVPLLCVPWLLEGRGRLRAALLTAGLMGFFLQLLIEVQAGYIAIGAGLLLLLGLMLTRPEIRARSFVFLALLCLLTLLRKCILLPWLDGSESLCLTLPGTRPLLLLPVGLACGGLARLLRRRPGKAVKPLVAWLMIALLVLAGLLAVALLPVSPVRGGLWELHELLNGRPQDSYGSWRLGAWRHSLAMFAEHPLFGGGPDTFMTALEQRLAQTGAYLGEHFDNPHNLYLGILVNNGLPALTAYLLMLFFTLRRCVKRATPWHLALCAAIVGYSVQAFFSFSICLVAPMAWCVIGMAVGEE